MKRSARALIVVLVISVFSSSYATASAQTETTVATTLQSVSVGGLKNPQEFDFGKGLKAMRRFDGMAPNERDKIRLAFYLKPKKVTSPDDIQLDLDLGEATLPIQVLHSGEIIFPSVDPTKAQHATVVSNVPKGTLEINYKIDIRLNDTQKPTAAYLREALSQARTAWKRLYGVGAFLVPDFDCVQIQFQEPQSAKWVETTDGNETTLWASPPATDVQVPVDIEGINQDAVLEWNHHTMLRIAACRRK